MKVLDVLGRLIGRIVLAYAWLAIAPGAILVGIVPAAIEWLLDNRSYQKRHSYTLRLKRRVAGTFHGGWLKGFGRHNPHS